MRTLHHHHAIELVTSPRSPLHYLSPVTIDTTVIMSQLSVTMIALSLSPLTSVTTVTMVTPVTVTVVTTVSRHLALCPLSAREDKVESWARMCRRGWQFFFRITVVPLYYGQACTGQNVTTKLKIGGWRSIVLSLTTNGQRVGVCNKVWQRRRGVGAKSHAKYSEKAALKPKVEVKLC